MAAGGTKKKTQKHVGYEATAVLDPDNMAHEIYLLKKERVAYQQESKLMQTKLATLDRELKEAYMLARQAEEAAADATAGTTTSAFGAQGKRGVSEGRLVSGLKRNVRELRLQLTQQEKTIHALQADIKLTNLDEARLEAQINYDEVMRLRILLEQGQDVGGGGGAGGGGGVTPSIQLMRKLKETARVLEAENEELKVDLEHALAAAYQLREDVRPSIGEPGTAEAAFDGKSREDILTQLLNANRVGKAHSTEIAALKEELRSTKSELNSQLSAAGADQDDVGSLRAKLRELADDNAKLKTELGDGDSGGDDYTNTATSPIKAYLNNPPPPPPSVSHRSTSPIKSSPLKRSITSSTLGSIQSESGQHQHDHQHQQGRPRQPSPTLSVISHAPTVRDADQLSTVGDNGIDHTFIATSEAAMVSDVVVVFVLFCLLFWRGGGGGSKTSSPPKAAVCLLQRAKRTAGVATVERLYSQQRTVDLSSISNSTTRVLTAVCKILRSSFFCPFRPTGYASKSNEGFEEGT